jgi:multisubunit Na+/H+ antiporter MnhE subunit
MTTRFLAALIAVTVVYAMTLASFHVWDLALGALLGTGLLVAFRPFLFGDVPLRAGTLLRRIIMVVPFTGAVILDIVKGTWYVSLIVLHLRPLSHPGIVVVPIGDRSSLGVAVTGLATTLSPGSFLVDVEWDKGLMLFHVLDATDPNAIRAGYQHFYERYQRHVFP